MNTTLYRLGQGSLSLVFIGSGLIPWLISDPTTRLILLQPFPFPPSWHHTIFYLLVALDIGCGILIVIKSGRLLWWLIIGVICGYTVMISVYAPTLWQDPFASLLKNLPLLSWAIALLMLEPKLPASLTRT